MSWRKYSGVSTAMPHTPATMKTIFANLMAVFPLVCRPACHRSSGDYGLEVLGRHDETARPAPVGLPKQRDQVSLERSLTALVERRERLMDRPIVGPEHVDPVLGRAIPELEVPNCMRN